MKHLGKAAQQSVLLLLGPRITLPRVCICARSFSSLICSPMVLVTLEQSPQDMGRGSWRPQKLPVALGCYMYNTFSARSLPWEYLYLESFNDENCIKMRIHVSSKPEVDSLVPNARQCDQTRYSSGLERLHTWFVKRCLVSGWKESWNQKELSSSCQRLWVNF